MPSKPVATKKPAPTYPTKEVEYASAYDAVLGKLFLHKICANKAQTARAVRALGNSNRTDVSFGSSFAVISGIGRGYITLHLSQASYMYLVSKKIIEQNGEFRAPRSRPGAPDWVDN